MRNNFNLYDRAQIKPDATYINPEFHGQTGKIIAFIRGELGNNICVFKFDEPYHNPVFIHRVACITISTDLLDKAV